MSVAAFKGNCLRLSAILCSSLIVLAVTASAKERIKEAPSYEAALQQAKDTNKPLLLEFYTNWCMPCKWLDTTTYIDTTVVRWAASHIIFKQLNAADSNGSPTPLAKQYNVIGYPLFILLHPDGTEIDRSMGYLEPSQFVPLFENYLNDRETLGDYLRRVATKPNAHDYFVLAQKYSEREDTKHSSLYFRNSIALTIHDSSTGIGSIYYNFAALFNSASQYDSAIYYYHQLIRRFPKSPFVSDAIYAIAWDHEAIGDTARAINEFKSALLRYPDSQDAPSVREELEELKTSHPSRSKQ